MGGLAQPAVHLQPEFSLLAHSTAERQRSYEPKHVGRGSFHSCGDSGSPNRCCEEHQRFRFESWCRCWPPPPVGQNAILRGHGHARHGSWCPSYGVCWWVPSPCFC
ncbi:unnamed protein product [Ectocarpus sp. 8 AP-2014]